MFVFSSRLQEKRSHYEPISFIFIYNNYTREELANCKTNDVTATTTGVSIMRKLRGRVSVLRLSGALYYI